MSYDRLEELREKRDDGTDATMFDIEREELAELSNPILAIHFVGDTLRDGRPVPPDGVWLEETGPIVICERGLHASDYVSDALQYAPGPVCCLVEVQDVVTRQPDKLVARRRKIIARFDATALLRRDARLNALSVIGNWDAPPVVLGWLHTGDESLRQEACIAAFSAACSGGKSAACSAAFSAAESAARSEAESATCSAPRSAAWSAAESAAYSAAESAARGASSTARGASSAAWGAVWSAAYSAAESAAFSAARARLHKSVMDRFVSMGALSWPVTK